MLLDQTSAGLGNIHVDLKPERAGITMRHSDSIQRSARLHEPSPSWKRSNMARQSATSSKEQRRAEPGNLRLQAAKARPATVCGNFTYRIPTDVAAPISHCLGAGNEGLRRPHWWNVGPPANQGRPSLPFIGEVIRRLSRSCPKGGVLSTD